MARRSGDDVKAEILDRIDIVDLIGDVAPLKKAGGRFKGLCPFHSEKTPSFSVDRDKKVYHCFGCGAGGDMFSFVMEYHKLSFPEAVEFLARRAGIQLPERSGSHSGAKRSSYFDITSAACDFYHNLLVGSPEGRMALDYLGRRQISRESIDTFRLGYGGNSWEGCRRHLRQKGYSDQDLEHAGLLSRSDRGPYDRFCRRLIFPIFRPTGQVAGFGGRILEGNGAKYLNSPETAYFKKSKLLFGLNQARRAISQASRVVLVEGYTDVIMCHQCGIDNAVATLGTALTEDHVLALKRLDVDATLVFDGDAAGQAAADKCLVLFLKGDVDARVVTLEDGLDPCDFLLRDGPEEFLLRLEDGVKLLDFKLSGLGRQYDLTTVTGQSRAVDDLLEMIGSIDALDVVKRNFLLRRIADTFRMPENDLRRRFAQRNKKNPNSTHGAPPNDAQAMTTHSLAKAEDQIIFALMEGGRITQKALSSGCDAMISDPKKRKLAEAIRSIAEIRSVQDILVGVHEPELRKLLGRYMNDWRLKTKSDIKRKASIEASLDEAIRYFQKRKTELTLSGGCDDTEDLGAYLKLEEERVKDHIDRYKDELR